MIVRTVDVNGDWTFGRGKNDYRRGRKAIAQNIRTRIGSYLGDCFFERTAGIDWFNLLGTNNIQGLKLALAAVIINTPGVTQLLELSSNLDQNRRITLTYAVNTVYTGTTDDEGIVQSRVALLLTESGDVLVTEDGMTIQA